MIPDAILHQIQDRADIVELIGAYVPLKRAGRNFKGPCPFHQEKTPSFIVSPDKQIFHCFGCGVGGNAFSFLMKQEKKDFREAVEMLAEQVGVEIPKDKNFNPQIAERAAQFTEANRLAAEFYHGYLLKNKEAEAARRYFEERGIKDQAILNFKLGFAPESWDTLYREIKAQIPQGILEKTGLVLPRKEGEGFYDRFRNRIIFPILDAKGICVAFGGRVMDHSLPKYVNSPETEIYSKGRHLYGLFQARKAIREQDSVIVVEGYMDLIACHQAGVENTVASLGTALTTDQVRLIKRHTSNVFIVYDADKAGELATTRGLELFLEEGLEVKVVRLSEGHDPDSYIRDLGVEEFRQALSAAQTLFEYRLALLEKQYDTRSLDGKVKIANEMVLLFAKVKNEILKSAWTRELAERLGLSEESLKAELRRGKDSTKNFKETKPAQKREELKPVEKLLAGLLLNNFDYIVRAKEEVSLNDFQHHGVRSLVKRLFEESQSAMSPAQWINAYQNEPEFAELISLVTAEVDTLADKNKSFEDCLLWLKRSRIVTEREHLKTQIADAEREGDKNRISKLLYDFNELNKGIKKINEKK